MHKVVSVILSFLFLYSCNGKNIGIKKHNVGGSKESEENNIMKENIRYAYFSSGCFWGTEYWFEKADGVISVVSGYAGGHKVNPTYREVCSGLTGHLETVRVEYDYSKTTYEELVKLFFETHDFTQANGQGPDIGSQYLSAIFYQTPEEKEIAKNYVNILKDRGHRVATSVREYKNFYEAEDYHQDYYAKKGSVPYCHFYNKIF